MVITLTLSQSATISGLEPELAEQLDAGYALSP
jgi:hypothetical protein